MEQQTLPQNKSELKELIVEIIKDINEKKIPEISEDEESEIEELYADKLEEPRNSEDYESL